VSEPKRIGATCDWCGSGLYCDGIRRFCPVCADTRRLSPDERREWMRNERMDDAKRRSEGNG